MDLTNNELQKQQCELTKIEREIRAAIPKLQEFINALKVEELQIKSSLLGAEFRDANNPQQTSSQMTTSSTVVAQNDVKDIDINQQEIMLDFLLKDMQTEEDSD